MCAHTHTYTHTFPSRWMLTSCYMDRRERFKTREKGNMLVALIPAGVETKVAINCHWIWPLIGSYFSNNSCVLVTEIWQNGPHIILHVINTVIYGLLLSCNLVHGTKFGNSSFCCFGSILIGDISSITLYFFLPLPKITNTSINGEKGKRIWQTTERKWHKGIVIEGTNCTKET